MNEIPLTATEKESVLTLCWMAANADGVRSESELSQLRQIAQSDSGGEVKVEVIHDRVMGKLPDLDSVVGSLKSESVRRNAYEMAVCVCHADGPLKPMETAFLEKLRSSLGLGSGMTDTILRTTADIAGTATPPPAPSATDSEIDAMVKNYAILSGALEILPDAIAHFSILPSRLRMVYRIGKIYGITLDRGHITELLAAAGLSMTSQMVEDFARKVLGGVLGKLAGGLGRAAGQQAASSGLAFATTYALGQLARKYYAGGRKLSAFEIRETFQKLVNEARSLQGQFTGDIQRKAAEVNPRELNALISSQ